MSDDTQKIAFDLRQYLGNTIAPGQAVSVRGSFGEVAKGTVLEVGPSRLHVKGTADIALPVPYKGPITIELETYASDKAKVRITYQVKDNHGNPVTRELKDDAASYGVKSYWVEFKPTFGIVPVLLQLARNKEATDIWINLIKYWMVPAHLVQYLPDAASVMAEPVAAVASA